MAQSGVLISVVNSIELMDLTFKTAAPFFHPEEEIVLLHCNIDDTQETALEQTALARFKACTNGIPHGSVRWVTKQARTLAGVSDSILSTARELNARLLCIGTKHCGGAQGRVSDPVMRKAKVPVLVARTEVKSGQPLRFLIGVTLPLTPGFPSFVFSHARGSEVIVAHVVGPHEKEHTQEIQKDIAGVLESIGAPTTKVSFLPSGDVRQTLCFASEQNQIDILCLANAGRQTLGAELGSVCGHCIYHAPCSVLVYHGP